MNNLKSLEECKEFISKHIPMLIRSVSNNTSKAFVPAFTSKNAADETVNTIAEALYEKINKKPEKRYFIVFATLLTQCGISVLSHSNVITNGEYVESSGVLEKSLKKFNEMHEGRYIFSVYNATSIVELSESDYKDWVK